MTPLRQRFIEDLQLRNRSPRTVEAYVAQVARFAAHFGRSPEELTPEHVRQDQLHLVQERKASWSTFNQTPTAWRSATTGWNRSPAGRSRSAPKITPAGTAGGG